MKNWSRFRMTAQIGAVQTEVERTKTRRHATRNEPKRMTIKKCFFVRSAFLSKSLLRSKMGLSMVKWRSGERKNTFYQDRSLNKFFLNAFALQDGIIYRKLYRSGRHLVEPGRIPLIWSNISAAYPAFRPQLYWHFGLASS